jgi:hypothetical protein
MVLPDETKRGTLQTPASSAEPDELEAQIKALKRLLQKPAYAAKRQVSESKEQQLTAQVNSLTAKNRRLADDIEKLKKELGKYRAYAVRAQAEASAAIADKEASTKSRLEVERSLKQLQVENGNLKSKLEAARVLLKIPILKSKIVYLR